MDSFGEMQNVDLTVDLIYKKLIQKLTVTNKIQDVSSELLAMTDNADRVLCVYRYIKSFRLYPLVVKIIKDDFMSAYYRSLGNHHYERLQLFEALQYYNIALLYAPYIQSENYSLALSNRSAILAYMKKYKQCLADIELILRNTCPEQIKAKITRRKKVCEDALRRANENDENDAKTIEILKLKGTRHNRYINASSKLKVQFREGLGRHVVATDSIDVGEVIVQEDPYVSVILKSQLLFCCAYCTRRKFNLIPCPGCSFSMYCDRQCYQKAMDEYHCYECPLIASLVKLNVSKLEWLALRVTIKARTDHHDWDCVFASISEAESLVHTNNWGHVSINANQHGGEGRWIYDSQYYAPVQTLATNVDKRDISDIFQKCVSAAVLMHCLAVVDFNKTIPSTDLELKKKIRNFSAGTLLTHMMTGPTNMHSITANVENAEGNFVDEYNIGGGSYGFLSLINHSCSPNVVRYSKMDSPRMSLIALRPIKKGEMILDNYGAHHAVHTRDERRAVLQSQYKFTCACDACTNDWPLYQDLVEVPDLPNDIAMKKSDLLNADVIEALQKGDKARALELYKPLCELATALDPYMPCKELADCQEALKQCLAIISGVLPRGYNKMVEWEVPPSDYPGDMSTKFYTGFGARDLLC